MEAPNDELARMSGRQEPSPPDHRSATRADLDTLRDRITELDDEIIRLIGERRTVAIEIGRVKQELHLPVLDPAREAHVVRRVAEQAREHGVDPELARDVIWRIISAARQAQVAGPAKNRTKEADPPG